MWFRSACCPGWTGSCPCTPGSCRLPHGIRTRGRGRPRRTGRRREGLPEGRERGSFSRHYDGVTGKDRDVLVLALDDPRVVHLDPDLLALVASEDHDALGIGPLGEAPGPGND